MPAGGFPLVPEFLAARQGDLDLHPALLEIDAQRDERLAARTGALRDAQDLRAVQQELAGAQRIVVRVSAVTVGRDVAVEQEDLAALDAGVRVLQAGLARTQRLDLRPEQHDAGLVAIADEEV